MAISERRIPRSYSSSNLRMPQLLRSRARRTSDSATRTPILDSSQQGKSLSKQSTQYVVPSKPNLERNFSHPTVEPAAAKFLVSRLRLDRDHWRTRSLQQEARLNTADRHLKNNKRTITKLTELNADLQSRLNDAISTSKNILSKFHDVRAKHDAFSDQLNDANRTIMKLKKSDRAKGRVHQQILRLKAHIGGHSCGKKDTEQTLLEALAVANERIEELESAGKNLLDAMDKMNDNDGSEGGEGEVLSVIEAEVAFRGVLEDESFEEQKALWGHMLES